MSTIDSPVTTKCCTLGHSGSGSSALTFLAGCRLANPLQAEASLNQFFDSLLDTPPSALTYLNLLEQTRVPLCFVEEELARRYINKPLPLGDVEEQAFQQVIQAWRKVTRAYAQCAQLDSSADDPEHLLRVALTCCTVAFITRAWSSSSTTGPAASCRLASGWICMVSTQQRLKNGALASIYPLADALDASWPLDTHCAAAYRQALLMDLAGPYSLSVRGSEPSIRRWAAQWAPTVGIMHWWRPGRIGRGFPPSALST